MTHAQVRRQVARYRRHNRLGASTTWTRLSGGEPILDEGFFDLLEVLLGLPGRVYVETNGTMLGARPAWLARLVAQGSRVRLNISLKAGRPDQYSRITGAAPAAWEATFACLSGLVAAGVDFDLNALTLAEALFTAGQRRSLLERLAAIHPDLPARLAQERLTPYPQTTRRMADAATSGPG